MPITKAAFLRYRIIDKCLTNPFRKYPNIFDLIDECAAKLDKTFTISTIQKDIQQMKEEPPNGFSAPVKYSRIHNGYYYSDPDYSIHKINLNPAEVDALKAVTDVLLLLRGSQIGQQYDQAVTKIFQSLQEKYDTGDVRPRVVQMETQIGHRGFENFDRFLHAITERIPINFIYYSYRKRRFNSIIAHPYLLKEFQNFWFLVGWSEQHKSIRAFGIDRIFELLFLKKEFHIIPQEVIENYFNDIYGVHPLAGFAKQKITFVTNPLLSEYLRANPMHSSQKIKKVKESGEIIYELIVIPTHELVSFFLQNAPSLKVLQPLKLKNMVAENIKKGHFKYGL